MAGTEDGGLGGRLEWRWTPLAVAAVGGLLLLPWMGRVPLLDLDEPRYADCSRNMLESGDWVYPWFNGAPRHTKPAFFNWVQASIYAVIGVSEFSARLPSVLATVGTGLLLCFLTAGVRGRAVGVAALVTWLLLPQSRLWARMSITDAVLTCLLTGALVAAYRGIERRQGGLGWYALSGVLMGCAALTKGPVGVVVPGTVYLLYVALSRSWRRGFGQPGPYLALAVALAVCVPWYAAQIGRYGSAYTEDFFGRHNVQRYAEYGGGLGLLGWLWPIPTVLLFAFPVSVFLPSALLEPLRSLQAARGGDPASRWRLFLVAWVLANAVLFAPSGTRFPSYLMALYPGGTMLIADLLMREAVAADSPPPRSRWVVGACVLCGLLLAAGFAYGALNADALAPKARLPNTRLIAGVAWALAAGLALAGMACAVAWRRGRGWGLLVPVWGACAFLGVTMSDVAWPAVGLSRDGNLRTLALACRDTMPADAYIVTYGFDSSTVVYYSRRNSRRAPTGQPRQALRMLAERPGSRLLTTESWWPRLPAGELTVIRRAQPYVLAEPRAAGRAGARGSSSASAPAASTATRPDPPPGSSPPGSQMGSDGR